MRKPLCSIRRALPWATSRNDNDKTRSLVGTGFDLLTTRLSVTPWVIGLRQKIINADVVKIAQFNQDICCQRLAAGFDIAILSLGHTDRFRHLLLCQVVILSQILHSVFHILFTASFSCIA